MHVHYIFHLFQNLLFHGVMRFYFQDAGQKVATKCIRVASDATVTDVIGKCLYTHITRINYDKLE